MQLERNEILTGLLVIGTIAVIAFLLVLDWRAGICFGCWSRTGCISIMPPALNLVP